MANILLAEDDPNLGFMIEDHLQTLGHEVTWAQNGSEAFAAFKGRAFSLCLIDVMMPKMDGFELAGHIRALDEFIPLLFLTAKSMEEDRLKGFEIGGDDYILKPFSIQELDYRINVFLRRTTSATEPTQKTNPRGLGKYVFDEANLMLKSEDCQYSLTQMEGSLLSLLLDHENELVKREVILEKVWGENDYFKGRSLDVFITRLRKYLKDDPKLSIKNHHGVGFCLQVIVTNENPTD